MTKGENWSRRLLAAVDDLVLRVWRRLRGLNRPGVRKAFYAVMAAVFLAGLIVSIQHSPDVFERVGWWAVVGIALASYPMIIVLNIVRYQILAQILCRPMPFGRGARIIVSGVLLNYLPLPGSILARTAGLTDDGAGFSRAGIASIGATFIWLGVAALFSAVAAFVLELSYLAAMFSCGGLAAVLLGRHFLPGTSGVRLPMGLFSANFLLVLIMTIQYQLSFMAIGETVSFWQAAFLTISGPIGVVIAIAPAGLGVTESSAAFLSTLIGIEPSLAFLAMAVSRIVQLVVIVMVAASFLITERPQNSVDQ